jgi:hypothetical protein
MAEDQRKQAHDDRTSDVPEWARNRKQPIDPGSGFLWPRRCELHLAGHTPHVIQVKVCLRREPRIGKLESVKGNVVAVDFGDHVGQFRNHETERLLEIVGIGGTVRAFSSILQGWTDHCWSIAEVEAPWIPCNNEPLTATGPVALAERIRTHGGFLVLGAEAPRGLETTDGS